jgi:hypothetical protein
MTRQKKTPENGAEKADSEVNRVTKDLLEKLIHDLEDRIDKLRAVIAELDKRGYASIVTSNWKSSGLGGEDLLRRATEAMWTAIGEEAAVAFKMERMRSLNVKIPKSSSVK